MLEGQARLTLGAHGLTGGFEARDESLQDPGLPGGRSVAQHRALFVQDELALTPDFNLTLGLRHDRHQLYGDEWSPRLYGVWQASRGMDREGRLRPRLQGAEPEADRARRSAPRGPTPSSATPTCSPNAATASSSVPAMPPARPQAQVMLYDQRVEDLIEVRLLAAGAVPGIGTYTYENLARARMQGVEAALAQGLGAGFTARLNYAYLDARTDTGQRLEKRPRHSAAAQLDWDGDPWRANAYAEYSGDQLLAGPDRGAPAETAPGFTLVGAQVSRTLPWGLELALGVQNLGDVRLAEVVAAVHPRGAAAHLAADAARALVSAAGAAVWARRCRAAPVPGCARARRGVSWCLSALLRPRARARRHRARFAWAARH